MIKLTPPMGWNTWNTFAEKINEDLVLQSADMLVHSGLKDCGYEYVVVDDCWALRERDSEGNLVCDPEKFPHGMAYLADCIHKKGLKFGMYSSCGTMTCQAYPASYGYEYKDAATFASWGVDYLKYDYCYKPTCASGKDLFRRMGMALANCGREILFSACSWGADGTCEWVDTTGANIWRSTPDIFDSWESVKNLIKRQYSILPYGGQGCFNDMDMLVVGMNGQGNVGMGGCTNDMYALHFACWCMFASPLMIGCDIRNMSQETKAILSNKQLIAINQDSRCVKPYIRLHDGNEDLPIIIRALQNGDLAICFVNMTEGKTFFWVPNDDLGVPLSSGKTLKGIEILSNKEVESKNGTVQMFVEPNSCAVLRLKVVDAK